MCVRVCARGVICAYALSFFTHYIKVAKSQDLFSELFNLQNKNQ